MLTEALPAAIPAHVAVTAIVAVGMSIVELVVEPAVTATLVIVLD
jgi:hypothetical protein